MSWWGTPSSGFSPGPRRWESMSLVEAQEAFKKGGWSRARQEKVAVLPGKETRLHQTDRGFEVQYRDTGVLEILSDGTYLLEHGGYPTKMTAQRINEYAPVQVWTEGPRHSEISDEGLSYHVYENLQLRFIGSPLLFLGRLGQV